MPETNMKPGTYEPESEITRNADPSLSDTWMIVVEKVCSLTGGDGAVIAMRDPEGVRCVASTGDAPPVGSRLQADSEFTRKCFETGSVMLCNDALADPRIQPSVAQMLHLRSVVAVPIQTKGSVLGLLEVFSSRPSAFDAAHITALQEIADLLAPFSALDSVNDRNDVLSQDAPSSYEDALNEAEHTGWKKNWVVIAASSAILLVLAGAGVFLLNSRSSGDVAVAPVVMAQPRANQTIQARAPLTTTPTQPTLRSTSAPITRPLELSTSSRGTPSVEPPRTDVEARPSVPVEPPVRRAVGGLNDHPVSRQQTESQVEVPPSLSTVVPPPTESAALFGTPAISGPMPPSVSADKVDRAVTVGGELKEPRLLSSVLPAYPTPRIEGDVVIGIVIDKNGNVSDAQVISGPPSLRLSALNAVRRWKYEPSKLDGQPTVVQMRVTIRFRL